MYACRNSRAMRPSAVVKSIGRDLVAYEATPHWYRYVYDMPKLLISLLGKLRSGEIRHFCAPSFVDISLAEE